MLSLSGLLCLALFCLFGSMVQSIAGMGFGMVVVPVATLTLGPANGVFFGNIACMFSSCMLLIAKHKDVEWKRGFGLAVASMPAIILTAWGLSHLHSAYLDLVVGLIMAGMVAFSFSAPKFPPFSGIVPMVSAGIMAAFLSTSVSQGGSALATYAQVSRWRQENFAATIQFYYVVLYPVIISAKIFSGLGGRELLDPSLLLPVAAAILIGVILSIPLGRKVGAMRARYFALSLSGGGAVLICARGLKALL